jgi:predicted Rossmann fold flavoprotein
MQNVDLAIVGAGAAGLMAGIWAGRSGRLASIVALESARKPGAKILVAGGGRCNVTHDVVDETAFAGSSKHAIRKVLHRFDVERTVAFFRELGVELKREESGKLFPVTDRARTVLEALLRGAGAAGVIVRHPCRVETVTRAEDGFELEGAWGRLGARRVILSTGGRSLPKSGSDGHGYDIARGLGHSITERVFPALVPLTLDRDSFIRGLAGLSARVGLEVRSDTGRRIASFEGSALCTHFGLSGPVVLDISRHYIEAVQDDAGTRLIVTWLPGETASSIDSLLRLERRRSAGGLLRERLPDRLARALCLEAGVDPSAPASTLSRERRRALAGAVAQMALPVTGHRGFDHAEVTAGGVPLDEIRLETMESRRCGGLHICGEICAVDGRIGGFNFQWAWASGYVAGTGAAGATA